MTVSPLLLLDLQGARSKMGVVNRKKGVSIKISRATRAVTVVLTYSDISAGALEYHHTQLLWFVDDNKIKSTTWNALIMALIYITVTVQVLISEREGEIGLYPPTSTVKPPIVDPPRKEHNINNLFTRDTVP